MSFTLLALFSTSAWAQTRRISGRVTEEGSNDPVAAATVTVVGTTLGGITDAQGRFTVPAPQGPATLRVRQANNLQLDVTLSPVREGDRVIELVALCEDVTTAAVRQQKLNALYKAGQDLDSLDADQLAEMNVACRVELLKQNVRRYVHDLLRYNVVEVRMLDPHTGRLITCTGPGAVAWRTAFVTSSLVSSTAVRRVSSPTARSRPSSQ